MKAVVINDPTCGKRIAIERGNEYYSWVGAGMGKIKGVTSVDPIEMYSDRLTPEQKWLIKTALENPDVMFDPLFDWGQWWKNK